MPLAGPGVRVGVSGPAGPVAGAPVSTPPGSVGLPGRVTCPVCGGENQPGMNFCRLCGSHLVEVRPPAPLPTPVPGGRVLPAAELHTCRRCGGHTQAGFAFCQHCGAMLPTTPTGVRSGGRTPPIEPVK